MSTPTSGFSRRIYVDTGAYYAVADADDTDHREALSIANHIVASRLRPFTTNFVLAETHALLLNRLGRTIALRVLQELDQSRSLTIVRVSASDERRARQILVQFQDKEFSLTDATSFSVMERLHIPNAFAFDQHFSQYGAFTVLPARH